MGKRLTDLQKIEVVKEYTVNKKNATEIARKYGVSSTSISSILEVRGIPKRIHRKYEFNENYFDVIDTEDKAYFLGVLYADGCNSEERGAVILVLQDKDKCLIDSFRKALNLKKKAFLVDRSKDKDSNKRRNQYRLEICSRHISERLAKLGCFKAKSLTLKFPTEEQVPKHLLGHFLRGVWDGDGNFLKYENKTIKVTNYKACLGSSIYFCNQLKEFMINNFSINCYLYQPPSKDQLFCELSINGKNQCKKFMDWIYKDCNFYLKRKYLNYKKIFKEK